MIHLIKHQDGSLEYEMKGIPVRVEIGPKDIENHQAVLVRRDTLENRRMTR